MRAASTVSPPIDAFFWMLAKGKFQGKATPLSGITRTSMLSFSNRSRRVAFASNALEAVVLGALYAPDPA
jgi:hypothetical protein